LETIYNININDARTYAIPIANIIGKRLNRIITLNNKLTILVSKLYVIPDTDDKTEICTSITKIISEIETLILKNIDDAQILEYALSEFTLTIPPIEKLPKSDTFEQHAYFA
jgi:hypothetical protein